MYVTFSSVSEYLFLLRAACGLLGPCGGNALLYLAAAVSDYYLPAEAMSEHKIQSSAGPLTLTLMPVPKVGASVYAPTYIPRPPPILILRQVLGLVKSAWCPRACMVTFKLETDPSLLEGKSRHALTTYKHDCVVANILTTRKHTVTLVTPYGSYPMPYNSTAVTIAHYTYTGGFTFTPGQSYYFICDNTPLGDFTTPAAVAPGGITIPSSGSPLSWSVEGNYDSVAIANSSIATYTTPTGGDEDSPFDASPYESAAGAYIIQVACAQSVSQVVGATILNTALMDDLSAQITK